MNTVITLGWQTLTVTTHILQPASHCPASPYRDKTRETRETRLEKKGTRQEMQETKLERQDTKRTRLERLDKIIKHD